MESGPLGPLTILCWCSWGCLFCSKTEHKAVKVNKLSLRFPNLSPRQGRAVKPPVFRTHNYPSPAALPPPKNERLTVCWQWYACLLWQQALHVGLQDVLQTSAHFLSQIWCGWHVSMQTRVYTPNSKFWVGTRPMPSSFSFWAPE